MEQNAVLMYEHALSNDEKLPKTFFLTEKDTKIREILTYVITEKLNAHSCEEAKAVLTESVIEQYHLTDLLDYVKVPEMLPGEYDHLAWIVWPEEKPSADELTVKTYDDVLSGRRKLFPSKYFIKCADPQRRAIVCFNHLCRDILKLDDAGILETFGNSGGLSVLQKYKLKSVCNVVFQSLTQLVIETYPHIFATKE